jgi:broad specificity phosphatase PhoE
MKIRVVLPDVSPLIHITGDYVDNKVFHTSTPVYFKPDTIEIDLEEFKDWCIKNYQLEVGCGERFDALVRKLEQFIKSKLR